MTAMGHEQGAALRSQGAEGEGRQVWPPTPGLPTLHPGDRVHLVGVGGAGMSGLARVLHSLGVIVSGSDRSESQTTLALRESGLDIVVGHGRNQVPPGCSLLVRSPAVPDDNPELEAARERGIPIAKRAQLLGALMDAAIGLAVAGTHGKTTTSGLLAYALELAAQAPTFFIGGEVLDLGTNARHGEGPYVVVEADEYDRSFHHGHPQIAVVTSLELDHPDIYPDIDSVVESFRVFASNVRPDGLIVANASFPLIARALSDAPARVEWYEVLACEEVATEDRDRQSQADWTARILEDGPSDNSRFEVMHRGETLGVFELRIPGAHNVGNALAVIAVFHALDLDTEALRHALRTYRGAGRRFQELGRAMGVRVIDDYAHHPTEITATLAAARNLYPASRIWAIVEPHTYSRVAALTPEFRSAISQADKAIVTPVYAAREAAVDGVTANRLAVGLPDTWAAPSLEVAASAAAHDALRGDTLIFMGAGDITSASRACLEALRLRAVDELLAEADRRGLGGSVLRGARLAAYTSLRVGGPADVAVRVTETYDLVAWHTLALELEMPVCVLGRGTNVLVRQAGFHGLVIVNRCEEWCVEESDGDSGVVCADSGVTLAALGSTLARHGWAGIEAGVGIPGSVGAAVITNAGAHGWCMADSLMSCDVAGPDGEVITWTAEDLEPVYRSTVLKGRHDHLLLSCRLRVRRDDPEAIAARIADYSAQRRATQPAAASAGSMFKNPPGDYAGRLIEACGLKGYTVGGASISEVHANFFINRGNATSDDIEALILEAQLHVREQFGIDLELEIETLGDDDVR
jgi:UDP-N-acetylmuramate--L-alanine ligase/UDP-N-acetylenolpyruvoylglucosamine reductase